MNEEWCLQPILEWLGKLIVIWAEGETDKANDADVVNKGESEWGVTGGSLFYPCNFFKNNFQLTIKDFLKSHALHNIPHKMIQGKTFTFLGEIRLFLGTKCQQASFQQTMKSV